MARCDHGFERSVVPCPVCDHGLSENARPRENASVLGASLAGRRKRGQGETVNRVGTFVCRGPCGREKALTEFYVSRTQPRGHQSRCKDCDNNKRVERLRRAS